MSKLETNTIDTVSGTTNLVIGSTNSSTVTFENGAATGHMYPAWMVYLSSNQSIPNTTATKVNFDSIGFDTDSVYDNTTNYDVTIPTNKGGKYWIYSRCWLDNVDGEGEVGTVRLYVNGSLATNPTFLAGLAGSTGDGGKLYLQVSGLIDLNDGDVLTIYIYHNSGASENARGGNCSFHGYRIGA